MNIDAYYPRADEETPFHPFADLFPLMEGEEFAALVADIKANGLREPVVLLVEEDEDGYEVGTSIVDGRNRYLACRELGIEPAYIAFDDVNNAGKIKDYHKNGKFKGSHAEPAGDLFNWIVSRNLHRRHLTTGQRAMVAAKLATMQQGARTDLPQNCGRSQTEVAADLKVSPRSVSDARLVLDQGTPELVHAVETGAVPVSAAAWQIRTPRVTTPLEPSEVRPTKPAVRHPLFKGKRRVSTADKIEHILFNLETTCEVLTTLELDGLHEAGVETHMARITTYVGMLTDFSARLALYIKEPTV